MRMEKKLLDLFARLSRDSERNKVYAMRAKKDGHPELSLLFMTLAASRAMQAQRFLMQARGAVAPTDENEQSAYGEEIPASIEKYRQLLAEAEEDGTKALATGFRHSTTVEQRNLELHDTFGERPQDTQYHVCDFCGYIAANGPPDNCPVCTAPKIRFKRVEAV